VQKQHTVYVWTNTRTVLHYRTISQISTNMLQCRTSQQSLTVEKHCWAVAVHRYVTPLRPSPPEQTQE